MLEDTYKTISEPSEGIYKEKGSKFISLAYPIQSETEFKEIQKKIEKKFHNARHRCYAYRIGSTEFTYRVNDDGEPSNTAGKPIYGQIQSYDITNILIYVIRYFGGTLLGISGLINAYRSAASNAIGNAKIVTKIIHNVYKINFNYSLMNFVMKTLKDNNLNQFNQQFNETCSLEFMVRKKNTRKILDKLNENKDINLEYIKTI